MRSAELGIAMDMGITLRSGTGALATIALSFNHDGPLGSTFRYICDRGTYVARDDGLVDGRDVPVATDEPGRRGDGVEVQDREFVAAVAARREAETSFARCLPAMELLARLDAQLRAAA
jgi:2-hydroxy-4-carboxymuconate semialdehyde hemiacetal dehydrogenase